MCGIHGFSFKNYKHIKNMILVSENRGPDANDIYIDDFVSLGHNLLNISNLPIEETTQPYISPKGNVLVFNGQIYKECYLDTKYLSEMLDYYGIEYLRNINGAFSLCWYEKKTKTITIARDHYGQRPLFYNLDNGLVFSSSIYSLKSVGIDLEKDRESIKRFLFNDRFWQGRDTFYKNIKKLVPGEYITFSVEKNKIISRGSLFDFQMENQKPNDKKIKKLIEKSIVNTVYNNNSTCVLLSGGLDSTTILNCSKNLDMDLFSLSCGYKSLYDLKKDEDYDSMLNYTEEVNYAKKTSKFYNIPFYDKIISISELRDSVKDSIKCSLLPFFDDNRYVVRYLTYKKAHDLGCKVIINGDGGDEIFTGYSGHDLYKNPNFPKFKYEILHDEFYEWFPKHVLGKDEMNNNFFIRIMLSIDSFCLSSDSLASNFSMESRSPFLYQELVKNCLNISGKYKLQKKRNNFRSGTYKYLLRELFKDELPSWVINKNIKVGWASPWNSRNEKSNFKNALKNISLLEDIIK